MDERTEVLPNGRGKGARFTIKDPAHLGYHGIRVPNSMMRLYTQSKEKDTRDRALKTFEDYYEDFSETLGKYFSPTQVSVTSKDLPEGAPVPDYSDIFTGEDIIK